MGDLCAAQRLCGERLLEGPNHCLQHGEFGLCLGDLVSKCHDRCGAQTTLGGQGLDGFRWLGRLDTHLGFGRLHSGLLCPTANAYRRYAELLGRGTQTTASLAGVDGNNKINDFLLLLIGIALALCDSLLGHHA